MTTAEEYRYIAEEFLRLAREAKTEAERRRSFDMALTWSQAAAREKADLDRSMRPGDSNSTLIAIGSLVKQFIQMCYRGWKRFSRIFPSPGLAQNT
jgi:hypothetical protein